MHDLDLELCEISYYKVNFNPNDSDTDNEEDHLKGSISCDKFAYRSWWYVFSAGTSEPLDLVFITMMKEVRQTHFMIPKFIQMFLYYQS